MITLDPFQRITKFNWPVGIADYAICYARLDPPYAVLAGYGNIDDPWLRDMSGYVEHNSIGDWSIGPVPSGSGNRSYPALDNGAATPLPTKLPTLEELSNVYIWHLGRTHAYALTDQIIVNVKKLRVDFPDRTDFRITLPATTAHFPQIGGDGDYVEQDFEVPSPRPPLRIIVGLRTYEGDGGEFNFAAVDAIDPFGTAIKDQAIAHYMGGVSKMTANFERFAPPTANVTVYNNLNLYQVRGMSWRIVWKNPKQSLLTAGPIMTQPL